MSKNKETPRCPSCNGELYVERWDDSEWNVVHEDRYCIECGLPEENWPAVAALQDKIEQQEQEIIYLSQFQPPI